MNLKFYIGISTVFSILLSACSVSADKPQSYTAPDTVKNISKELIIGTWQSSPLNPSPNAPESKATIEYQTSGKIQGTIETAPDTASGAPALKLTFDGDWNVQGELLEHSNIELKAVGDSAYAKHYNEILIASNQEMGSVTNVLELSDKKMITISPDGRATLYVRQ